MIRHETAGVAYYTFENLAANGEAVHGITGRHGGVSTGPWASLNLTKGNGDDPARVEENLRRVSAVFGVDRSDLVSPNQRHTTNAARVGREQRGQILTNTDTLLTNEPEVPILLRYADCTPVMLYDPLHRAFAVVHSGWRGTVAGAVPAAIAALVEAFGARPAELIAGVGPSIGPCCYEVGDEVASAVRASFTDAEKLLPRNGSARRHFDLWSANRRWLEEAGVRQIEVAQICTACHIDEFFSYRGGKGRTGHFGALMMVHHP
ncbi:MAG: peptidoglycan editing factor PgeF [Nitrososphaerales archaeon]